MKEKNLELDFMKGLERKLERPKRFWDAWNKAKKVPLDNHKYKPKIDFAYANGDESKKVLSGMFPNETKEIEGLTANQAMKAYFDIRSVYFG